MKYLFLFLLALYLVISVANAQTTDSASVLPVVPGLKLSGAVDVYYGFDFSEPENRNRQYTTQAYRHNEFNLNYGFLQADYTHHKVRATFALHTGTYVQSNYAAEPNDLTRLIGQANVGVQLAEGTWLDVGILPSHIGYEATYSGSNEIYTRALMAENSPYYEAGAQLTHTFSDQLTVKLLVLNGWQNIHETNSAKSLGVNVTYTPDEKWFLSYSNYYGNEAPDSIAAKRRFFHNFNLKYTFTDRFHMAGSVDYGRQELFGSEQKASWHAAMLIARYQLAQQLALAGRIERYHDKNQLIVVSNTPQGFQTSSVTLTLDYQPAPNLLWRLEGRGYDSKDKVFMGEDGSQDKNLLMVTSLALKF